MSFNRTRSQIILRKLKLKPMSHPAVNHFCSYMFLEVKFVAVF